MTPTRLSPYEEQFEQWWQPHLTINKIKYNPNTTPKNPHHMAKRFLSLWENDQGSI
jgi:hypothetical protein